MTISKNIVKNGFATVLSRVIRVLEQLFLIPFFITTWGAAYYGEWLTLTIIPSVLAFSNMGFGTAASNIMVLRYASGDKQGAANMAKSGLLITTYLILIGFLISILALFILYQFNIFDKSLIDSRDAIIAVALLIVAQLVLFYRDLYDGFFRSAQKAATSKHLYNAYTFIKMIGGLLVLLFKGNIVIFAIVSTIISFLFIVIYIWQAKRILHFTELLQAKVIRQDFREAFRKGLGFLMAPMWQVIYYQGTTLVVRLLLGPGAVAIFNTVRTMCRSINQLYSIVGGSVFPELQFLIGRGMRDKVKQLFRVSVLLSFSTGILGMLFLLFFGLWFYGIWTQKTLDPPLIMWYLFVISIGINAIYQTSSVVFQAMNKPFIYTVGGLIAALISVLFTYLFSKFWGLNGAALGALMFDSMMVFYLLPKSFKLVGISFKSFIFNVKSDYAFLYNKIRKSF